MHDVISAAITVATIIAAAFFSNAQLNGLRGEMNALRGDLLGENKSLRTEVHGEINSLRNEIHGEITSLRSDVTSRLDSIQKDMREFYAEQARHDVRISKLEDRR